MLPPHAPSKIGRYEIKSLIGAGGMGTLYLARDTNPNTSRLVALKLLNANLDSEDLRERFGREARALAALNHPNVVNIYDSGEYQWSPYIVMEYVRGETLAEKIKRQAPLTLGQKLKLMVELCAGLSHAHEAGIIHRDIKPANVMVDHHGRVKLLDFGIARAEVGMTRFGPQMTQVNVRIGTPGYMSPEQIEGGEIDRRSDIFAVGAVLYELLSYREAFSGATTRQIENKVLQSQPTPLVSLIPGLDPDLEGIVSKALAKDPNDRFQDATEFEQALDRQRWKAGPVDAPTPAPRGTPLPNQPRKSHGSRAEVAYQHALVAQKERAFEAAKRFVIEAVAEDPSHAGALALLAELDPKGSWTPPPPQRSITPEPPTELAHPRQSSRRSDPRMFDASDEDAATMLSTRGASPGGAADEATIVATRAHSSHRAVQQQSFWHRHGRTTWLIAGGVALLILLTIAGIVIALNRTGGSSETFRLAIAKPGGGTITGGGLNCGTGGSDCSVDVPKGKTVELEVVPDKGFRFTGFTGDCAPSGRTTLIAERTCGATFDEEPTAGPAGKSVQLLTIAPPTGGTVISVGIMCGTRGKQCSSNLQEGMQVKLEGWADQGFTFRGFTGDCNQHGETMMSAPRTCGATFIANSVAAAGKGSPAGAAGAGGPGPSGTGAGTGVVSPPPVLPKSSPGKTGKAGTSADGGTNVDPAPPPPPKVEKSDDELVAPPPPPKPPPPDVVAKKEIEELLERYRSAYEALNFEGIRRTFPAAPDALKDQFRQIKSLQYTFSGPPKYIQLDPYAGTALLEIGVTRVAEMKSGGGKPSANLTARINVNKRGADNDWIIMSVVHK